MKTLLLFLLLTPVLAFSQATELKRFSNENARQAVAVTSSHFYAINNSSIDMISKESLEVVQSWKDTTGSIPHLNSGIIIDDTLYCASSNYPKVPMTSTIEKFTLDPLRHIGSHSFGIFAGSCTWVLRTPNHWWAFFAHYENRAQSEGKGVEWSTLIRFDGAWRQQAGWVLPDTLVQKLRPYSLSGGIFVNENQLLVTGHHEPYVYLVELPKSGSELRFLREIPVPVKGQGLAIDPANGTFWGIHKKAREVINFKIEDLED